MAIGISVLVHLIVFAVLLVWVRPLPPPAPPARPFNVQIVTLPPPPQLEPKREEARPEPTQPARKPPTPKVAQRQPLRPHPSPAAPRSPPASTPPRHSPLASDIPRAAPDLVPHDVPGGILIPPPEAPSGGHLLRNDGKQHPTPEEIAREDAHARGNVQAWTGEDLARSRVADGSVDGFFSDLRHALEAAAKHPPPFKQKPGLTYQQSWNRDATAFGKTGALAAGNIPKGEMRDFMNHHDPIPEPGTNAELIQNGLAGTAMRRHASEQTAPGGLLAVVEVRQTHSGKVEAVSLRKSSGDPNFDAFVLASARKGAQKAPPMPDHGAGIHPEGTRSVWSFRGKVVFTKSVEQLKKEGKSTAGIAARAATSLLAGGLGFDEVTGEVDMEDGTPTYRVKVALLAVY